jgi:hypothetical protein
MSANNGTVTVKACIVCGLPLIEDYVQSPNYWRCNNEKDCIFREYRGYTRCGVKYSQATDLPEAHSFKVVGYNQDNICYTDLFIVVPPNNKLSDLFQLILDDAYRFAKDYDLMSFTIENTEGDVLYHGN